MPNPSLLTPAQLQAIRARERNAMKAPWRAILDIPVLLAHIEALEQELAAARQHMLSERDLAKLLNAALRGAPAPDQA